LIERDPTLSVATRLKGSFDTKRARIALARLRDAGIKPECLVAIVLAVAALIKEYARQLVIPKGRATL
jgi:hypothetical protein